METREPSGDSGELPVWRYGAKGNEIVQLQISLRMTDQSVAIDGKAGPLTSAAFREATGYWLKGDPRGA